jgi:hypothetical protein
MPEEEEEIEDPVEIMARRLVEDRGGDPASEWPAEVPRLASAIDALAAAGWVLLSPGEATCLFDDPKLLEKAAATRMTEIAARRA